MYNHAYLIADKHTFTWKVRNIVIMQGKQMYSIIEAALALNVHKDTVRRLIKRGEMQASQIGRQYRIPRSEVEKHLTGGHPKKEDQ
jgi:excisionase family DNA binding protein